MLEEFRDFAMRGNVVDMAVGIIIGGAFGAIVKSLVADIVMPPNGLLLGGVHFSNLFIVLKGGKVPAAYATLSEAQAAGAVTVNVGVFLNTVIGFLILALAVFLLVRQINRLQIREKTEPTPPTTKEFQYCLSTIPLGAKRCAHCTSALGGA